MDLEQARAAIGQRVQYTPRRPSGLTKATWTAPRIQVGHITSVGDCFVHVRYGTDAHAKATRPEDLVLTEPVEHAVTETVKTHRDARLNPCQDGSACKRRHDYIMRCSCGHKEWRGKLKYTRAAMDEHLAASKEMTP